MSYRLSTFVWMFLTSLVLYFFITSPWIFRGSAHSKLNRGFFFLIYMLVVLVVYLILKAWSRENRDRQLKMLPIPLRSIGLIRFLLDIVLWLMLIALLFLYSLMSVHFRLEKTMWLMLALTSGSVLIVIALASFWRDLVLPVKNRGENVPQDKVIVGGLNILIPLFFNFFGLVHLMLIVHALRKDNTVLSHLFYNSLVILGVVSTGLILAWASIQIFGKQVSQVS